MNKDKNMRNEPAHFACEHELEIKKDGDKIKAGYKQVDDYGRAAVVPDDIIRIAIVRHREGKTQLFKQDKWIDVGNNRIGKLGPTLALKKEDAEELLEDLLKVLKANNVHI